MELYKALPHPNTLIIWLQNTQQSHRDVFLFSSFSNQTETLTIPKAEDAKDEGTVQQGTGNPRGSSHTLMTTAIPKWEKSQQAEVLCCSDHEAVDFKDLGTVRSLGRRSLPWTTREQTLAFSRISLVECHGVELWREKQPKRAGWYWRVVSFRFNCNASLQRGNQERKRRCLHGWTKSSWRNLNS